MTTRLLTIAAAILTAGLLSACQIPNFSVGDTVRIYEDGLTTVTVAVDGDAWNDLNEFFEANDTIGYDELIASGRAFTITNGTQALVLDKGFTKTKVRIMSGQHTGETGYVPTDWVEKQ